MGLKTRSDGNIKYVKLKDGKFYLSYDKDLKEPFDELEGRVIDFFFRDEQYERTITKKLYVVVGDGEDKYLLGMNFESSYCSKLINFLENADLSKNVTISIGSEDKEYGGKEYKAVTLFLSQDGKGVKAAHTKDNPNGMPAMKKVRVNGKDVWDKGDMLAFFENIVNKKLKPQVAGNETAVAVTADGDDEASDDLPF